MIRAMFDQRFIILMGIEPIQATKRSNADRTASYFLTGG